MNTNNPTKDDPCVECGKTTICVGCWAYQMKAANPDNPKAWND